jgi:O-antigen/teichoic acid export membrane protein
VRSRTAWTLGFLAAPAAIGLGIVAPAEAGLLLGGGYDAEAYLGTQTPLRLLSLAVPALFLNGLLLGALVAAGRAPWLPRLTAARVLVAFAAAGPLVSTAGGSGASAGIVLAEWLLLLLAHRACAAAAFAVEIVRPLGWALLATLPMALAVLAVREQLALAVALGAGVQLIVVLLARKWAALQIAPGDLRYP